MMSPLFFAKQSDLRRWFESNFDKATEVYIGFYKVSTGIPSITWSQSVDEALCFGWIDGIRKSLDEESYSIRFTPRRAKSIWSAVNIKKVEKLLREGLMKPAGIEIFEKREKKNSNIYSFEKGAVKFSKEFERKFKSNKKAWNFFQQQVPSYKKPAINWVMSAKQEATRKRRLDTLVNDSEAGQKIKPLNYGKK